MSIWRKTPVGDDASDHGAEGIGQGRITANLEGFTPDFTCRVPDEEALPVVYDMLAFSRLEFQVSTSAFGLFVGQRNVNTDWRN